MTNNVAPTSSTNKQPQKSQETLQITTFLGRRVSIQDSVDSWKCGKKGTRGVPAQRDKVSKALDEITESISCSLKERIELLKKNMNNIQNISSFLPTDCKEAEELFNKAKKTIEGLIQATFQEILEKSKDDTQLKEEDLSIIDEGLSTLSEICSISRPLYISLMLDSLYKSKKFKAISVVYAQQVKALKEVKPLEDPNATEEDLQRWIENNKQCIPAEVLSRQLATIAYEDNMIKALEPYFPKDPKDASPSSSKVTSVEIEAFLLHALSNPSLNTRLRSKKNRTPAEQFVLDYTFATLGPQDTSKPDFVGAKGLKNCVECVQKHLDAFKLRECAENLDKVDEIERQIFASYQDIQKQRALQESKKERAGSKDDLKKINKVIESIDGVTKKIESFFKAYSDPSFKDVWDARKSAKILKLAQDILDDPSVKEENQKNNLGNAFNDLKIRVKEFRTCINNSKSSIEKVLNSKGAGLHHQALDSTMLGTINVFDTLVGSLEPLATVCHNFQGCAELKKLYEDALAAEKIMSHLRTLAQVTHSHEAGDIVLTDEVEKKRFCQRAGVAYSQFSIIRDVRETKLAETKKLIKKVLDGQIWTVQPYFTGSRSHARMLFPATMANVCECSVEKVIQGRGKTKRVRKRIEATGSEIAFPQENIEVQLFNGPSKSLFTKASSEKPPLPSTEASKKPLTAIFESQAIRTVELNGHNMVTTTDISESMYEVIYRPNFDNILTQEAKDAEIQADEAMRVYQGELKQLVEGEQEWKKIQEYQLDDKRAARSFILSLFPRVMGLKTLAAKLFDYLFSPRGRLRSQVDREIDRAGTKEDLQKIEEKVDRRFCSELVSILTREALDRTETELKKRYPDCKKPFHEIFPKYMGDDEIYPNLLEKLITKNRYFTKIGRPALLDTLFTDTPEEVSSKE